jgi:hypothetical protein
MASGEGRRADGGGDSRGAPVGLEAARGVVSDLVHDRRGGFTQPVSNAEALRQTVKWHLWHEYGASLPEGERSTLGRIRRELY